MPGSSSLFGFVAAALVLLLIPGPGVLYILTRSLGQGRHAGLVSVLGLAAGALVSILNPKIAIFFLAFLPQFVDPERGPIPQQVLLLGLLYVALALVTDGCYAWLAGSLREWLGGRVSQGPLPRYASGVLYLGLGVSTALTGRRS